MRDARRSGAHALRLNIARATSVERSRIWIRPTCPKRMSIAGAEAAAASEGFVIIGIADMSDFANLYLRPAKPLPSARAARPEYDAGWGAVYRLTFAAARL